MITFIANTFLLSLSIIFAFYWTQNPKLDSYSLQAIGLLVLFYFINRFHHSKLFDCVIITLVVLLVILTTGGLESPAVFLIFVLAFIISLLLHPLSAFIAIALIALLLSASYSQIFIWLLIPPLITLISKQYLEVLESQQKIKTLQTKEKIYQKEVKNIETDISTFCRQSLTTLENLMKKYNSHELKTLYENIKSLPDKISEEAG